MNKIPLILSALLCAIPADLISQESSGGLSLDSLMSAGAQNSQPNIDSVNAVDTQAVSTPEPAKNQGLSLDNMMAPAVKVDAASASTDLSTIKSGRAIVNQRNAYAGLLSLDQRIGSQCRCTDRGNCFSLGANLRYDQTIQAAEEAASSLGESMRTVCNSWPGAGQDSQSMDMIETRQEIGDKVLLAITDVQAAATDMQTEIKRQDQQIYQAMVAQQEASQPGFNWGQFAAMTAGVVAGGVSNLDASQQTEIFSSIVADSMNGGGNMSSLQSTMDSLNADLATQQQAMNNSLAKSNASLTGTGSQSGINQSLAELNNINQELQAHSQGSSGFDPAMRPGGVTQYDQVGNASGIQGTSSTSNHAGTGVINETYSFTCPSGNQANIPIVAMGRTCANAMRNYAKVMSCNLIDEMESAQRQYESACAAEMF